MTTRKIHFAGLRPEKDGRRKVWRADTRSLSFSIRDAVLNRAKNVGEIPTATKWLIRPRDPGS